MCDRQLEIKERNRPDSNALAGNIASYKQIDADIQKLTNKFEQDLKRLIDKSDWSESDKDTARTHVNDDLPEMIGEIVYYPNIRLAEMKGEW